MCKRITGSNTCSETYAEEKVKKKREKKKSLHVLLLGEQKRREKVKEFELVKGKGGTRDFLSGQQTPHTHTHTWDSHHAVLGKGRYSGRTK